MWKIIISKVFEIFSKEFSLNPLDSLRLNETEKENFRQKYIQRKWKFWIFITS